MRLIDADAFEKWAYSNPDIIVDGDGYVEPYAASNFALDHTIEAEPVKHGRWVSLTECANAGVYCSVCHKKVWKEDYAWCNRKNKLRSDYCPNCGARMDGE
jgi:hypothetical protein